jgi:hypothetical protein
LEFPRYIHPPNSPLFPLAPSFSSIAASSAQQITADHRHTNIPGPAPRPVGPMSSNKTSPSIPPFRNFFPSPYSWGVCFHCHDHNMSSSSDRKRPLGRPRRRWIDNIMTDLLEIGLGVVDWISLAQDRYRWNALMKAVMDFRLP